MANELLPALKARGHEFLVLADQGSPELPAKDEYRGIRIRRFPFAAGLADVNTLADIRKKIVRLKRAFAPDLCHVLTLGATDFYHRITATTSPTPLVVSLRGIWPRQVERPLMQTLEAADWVACNSLSTLEYARRLVPKISSYSSVIYNALREPSMPREPLPFDPPRLLFLGRLSPEKRVDLALDAFAEIRSKHPRAQLVIAGDGVERRSLETQAAHLELGDCVQFHGWIRPEDVPAWINSATVLLLPSEREAFGLAALEAGLMGRPVVASRRGGLPEVIEHGKTGLLVEPLDSAGVAEAAIWLLDHPDEARRMGEAAAVHTREHFIWEGCVNAHEALYKKLVRKPNRHLDGERDV